MKVLRLSSKFFALVSLIFVTTIVATAQTSSLQDTTAASLLRSSLAAMTSGVAVTDVTLQMTGAQTVGPDMLTATANFYGRVDGHIRLDFDTGSGAQSDSYFVTTDGQRGLYRRNPAGTITKGALHAAWISDMWLSPPLALSRVLQYPEYRFVYKGRQTLEGKSVEQISIFIDDKTQDADSEALTAKLSTVELFLDSTTLLPTRVTYNIYPDKSFTESLPFELRFNNFAPANGVLVPWNITAYFNYGPWRLYQVSSLQINAGIVDATFELGGGAQ